MSLVAARSHWVMQIPEFGEINSLIVSRILEKNQTDSVERSHFFEGRYENIYIPLAEIPEMEVVLEAVRNATAQILTIDPGLMRAGFWFNIMAPGDVTLPHNHEEDGEIMSAVYYLRMPPDSGPLKLHTDPVQIINSAEGDVLLFAPNLMHEVIAHRGAGVRMSVGINVGLC